MIFRRAVNEDRQAVAALYDSVRHGEFCAWDDEYPGEYEINADLAADCLFVLEAGKEMIGAVSINPENELDGYEVWNIKRDAGEISRVVIRPDSQGQGLSVLLVKDALEELRKRDFAAVHLSAAKRNIPAVKLYRSLGFDFLGEYFMYGSDFYLCELALPVTEIKNINGGNNMTAQEAIAARYSCRLFDGKMIPEYILAEILRAGMAAPVGSGAYDTLHITTVKNAALLKDIGDAVTDFISAAFGRPVDKHFNEPVLVVLSSKPGRSPGSENANAACVLENMAISASGFGVNSVIHGSAAAVLNQNAALRERLCIPEGFAPVLCISLGYAKETESSKAHEITVNTIE